MINDTIFVADDDTDDWYVLGDAMKSVNPEIVLDFSKDGNELLEHLVSFYSQDKIPCLIILDLNMPKLNGTETLKIIKSDDRFKNIPIIIYSTSVNGIEKEKCMQLGARDYVTKPVTFAESVSISEYFNSFCKHEN